MASPVGRAVAGIAADADAMTEAVVHFETRAWSALLEWLEFHGIDPKQIPAGTRVSRDACGWPELTQPTAEQWLAWLRACTPEEQLEIAARVLGDNDAAMRCVVLDHERLREELLSLDRVLQDVVRQSDRYRTAWHSARRRGWWFIQRRLDEQEAARR